MNIQLTIPFTEFEEDNVNQELSYWSYRIIEKEHPSGIITYGIYVVDYNIEGSFLRHAESPIGVLYRNVKALKKDIERLQGAVDSEILKYQN